MILDYLIIAAHPDDAEIGVGGTMALLLAEGKKVGILDLTDGEPTPRGSKEIRQRETESASAVLQISWRENLGLPNRALEATLEARARLAGVIRRTKPRVLFAPYWEDSHPDHVSASALVDAARFWAKLTKTDLPDTPHYPQKVIYYFSVHLRVQPSPSFVVDISGHMETKMKAIGCYESQFVQESGVRGQESGVMNDIRARARYWGWSIGVAYGEPFLCREAIGVRTLENLL